MTKSGLADSPFFTTQPKQPSVEATLKDSEKKEAAQVNKPIEAKPPRNRESMQASNHARMQASKQESMVELIRKTVKDIGKESATYRFTPEEKKALLELTFTYKVQGFKTSENELTRIAINFLLEDHKQNGRNSILARVLEALNE